jgi:hypothetical protein
MIQLLNLASKGDSASLNAFRQAAAEAILSTQSITKTTKDIWGSDSFDFDSLELGDTLSSTKIQSLKDMGITDSVLKDYLAALGYTLNDDGTGAVYNGMDTSMLSDWAEERNKEIFEADEDAYLDIDDELDKYYAYNKALSEAE